MWVAIVAGVIAAAFAFGVIPLINRRNSGSRRSGYDQLWKSPWGPVFIVLLVVVTILAIVAS